MPLSGSMIPRTYSRLGLMRLGASRLDYYPPVLLHTIPGRLHVAALSIRDLLDGTPNTATMRVSGYVPVVGEEIQIGLGSLDVHHLVFAGHILTINQIYLARPANVAYDINAISYEWLLLQKKVTKRYTSMSASAIVLDVIATYTSGVTTNGVVAGLDTIDEITFTNEDVPSALDRLSKRIGGYWRLDYANDLKFFLTESDAANTISNGNDHGANAIAVSTDDSQLRTRVSCEGGGSNASVDLPVGAVTIPVETSAWYNAAGGVVTSGPQRIPYTSKSLLDGTGSTVAGMLLAPGSFSDEVIANTAGRLSVGAYLYKASFVTPVGESEVGTATGGATIATVTAPSALTAAEPSPKQAGNLSVGTYLHRVTFVTAAGETTGGTATGGVTIDAVSTPGAPGAAEASPLVAGNLLAYTDVSTQNSYKYAVTYVTASGETTTGTATSSDTLTSVSSPASAPSGSGTTGGSLTTLSQYWYAVSYVHGGGETTATPMGGTGVTLTGAQNAVSLTSIPTSGDARVTARRIYRSLAGFAGGTHHLLTTINDNSTTTLTDTTADSTIATAAAPNTYAVSGANLGTGKINLTSIPTSSDGRVTKRRIYRQFNGSGAYKLVTTLNDNSTTTFLDNVANESLGSELPSVDTSGSGRLNLTSIPVSSDGRVTKRKIYRTEVGGSVYKLLTTLNDNSTTTYTDNTADAWLGVDVPVVDTSGSGQVSLTNIPLGPAGTTARRLYRTDAGGSTYRFLRAIGDNSTTTYTDNVADENLGEAVPIESHVGASAGNTTLRVKELSAFALVGAEGWVRAGEQIVKFTGRSTSSGEGTLTGVPASGAGAIGAPIGFGVSVVNHPHLYGVTGVLYTIKSGDPVNLFVTVNDTTAQTAAATAIGSGDGIFEEVLQDNRLSETEATARAEAHLALTKDPLVTVTYRTRDQSTRSGRSVTFSLGAPNNITGTYKIQRVTLTGFDPTFKNFPELAVDVSSRQFSFEALLRQMRAA